MTGLVPRPHILAAIDPGAKGGIAVFKDGAPGMIGSFNGKDLKAVAAWCTELVRLASLAPIEADQTPPLPTVVIERQFIGRGKKANPRSADALTRRRVEWETILRVHGITAELVYPSTWQRQISQVARFDDAGKPLSIKQRYTILARRLYGASVHNENEAAAALMGRWYLTERCL